MDLFNDTILSDYIETGIPPDFDDLIYRIKTHIHGHERPITHDECVRFVDREFELYLEELEEIKRKMCVLQRHVVRHIKNSPLN
jgi:hypothetical protein